jgi:hypothetical protein
MPAPTPTKAMLAVCLVSGWKGHASGQPLSQLSARVRLQLLHHDTRGPSRSIACSSAASASVVNGHR